MKRLIQVIFVCALFLTSCSEEDDNLTTQPINGPSVSFTIDNIDYSSNTPQVNYNQTTDAFGFTCIDGVNVSVSIYNFSSYSS